MRAYILSIGSELLHGHITDTNATYLAQELSAVGIDLVHVTQCGDDSVHLKDALQLALARADVVICTGGVGPTDDDLTRETIADVVGETPTLDPDLLAELRAFFRGRGSAMPERNAKQAWTIPSSRTLPNPVGTAPGWFVETNIDGPRVIVAMPGVPREMFRMWREQALPRLQELAGNDVIDTTVVKTLGIGESAAEQTIHALVQRADPIVATYAKDDGVHVHITAVGDDPTEVRTRRDACVAEVESLLGPFIWGRDSDTLAGLITHALRSRNQLLRIVESGTGGAMASLFVSDPDIAGILIEATVRPVEFGRSPEESKHIAVDLAARAATHDDGSLGVALSLSARREERGIVRGQVHVAVAVPGTAAALLRPGALRSSLADVQRRAGLHAIDALREHLATT